MTRLSTSSFSRLSQSIISLTVLLIICAPGAMAFDYICGDANGDGKVNVGDAVFTIRYVFLGDPIHGPLLAADANCDNAINIGDAVYLIRYVFLSGPVPCCPGVNIITGVEGCKSNSTALDAPVLNPIAECIEYEYDGEDMLLLKHINAYFNCCPNFSMEPPWNIHVQITVGEDYILFDESDNDGSCKCACHFDVDYKVFDVVPGIYTIRFYGVYNNHPDDPLEFTVDLTETTSGTICVE